MTELNGSSIAIENIDRKTTVFSRTSPYQSDENNTYLDPEVIIIKNGIGRDLFNRMIKQFDYKEKGAIPIDQVNYPYYVLTCEWLTAGCRFGKWAYFENLDDLSQVVVTEGMTDDFPAFREALMSLLNIT
ncbi:MAG: hypothetical protein OEZ39_16010 [Gammaproteobacteria bacterium]|nr:hypothetical protein [Gammaproteobacteria bacterium]MDH5653363.1 hypothetical protein [Gammaproteobacteria bacterium]